MGNLDREPVGEKKASEKPPLRTRILEWAAAGVGGVSVAAVALYGLGSWELIREHMRDPTAQESEISNLTHSAFGEAMTIRCVEVIEGNSPFAVATTKSDSLGIIEPITYLQTERCDALSDFIKNPNVDPSDPKSWDAQYALIDVGHEYSHEFTKNESDANCLGAQRTRLLAEAAGATPEQATALQQEIATERFGTKIEGALPEQGVIQPNCAPGKELDLGIPNVVFPQVGRVAG